MMAGSEYATLVEAFRAVPDPRQRRGKRDPWWLLLTLVAAAMLDGERHGRGIGQWVHEHRGRIRQGLGWQGTRLPSTSTLRRTLREVDLTALEAHLSAIEVPRSPRGLVGQALDGKTVRGVGAHDVPLHLVSLVRHDGIVVGEAAVDATSNEITAAPRLLARRDLTGTVTTMDAELTQRRLARQIVAQGGDELMVVKANQPELRDVIETLFAQPPWLVDERAREYRRHTTVDKGHGRMDRRELEASPSLADYLDWPGIGQVLKRTCRRVRLRTGEMSEEVTDGITSLSWATTPAALLERLWRGHWAFENRVHDVRDVTLGEDAGQAWRGQTPQALAALRNALLNLVRGHGWTNISDAVRHYAASLTDTVDVLGVNHAGL